MEFKGRQPIRASRADVWAALNDPAVLRQCIDGCEEFTADGDGEWRVVVRASVGPVKARFKGMLSVHDRRALQGYRLRGRGEGGVAGFGEMSAVVTLEDEGPHTVLVYTAEASVGGKLAQIGSRLVGSVGARMAERFFSRFDDVLTLGGHSELSHRGTAGPGPQDATRDLADDEANVVLTVNGVDVRRRMDERTLLVDLLRRELRLTGTHVGCDTSQCGACTVRLDGVAVKSCTVLAVQASGGEVVTIEGLSDKGTHPLQKAFVQCHGLQCGFCTPGMIMASDGLLRSGQRVDHAAICTALEGNICRCTGYVNIVRAVDQAAREMGLHTGSPRTEGAER